MFMNIRIIRDRAITAYPSGNDLRHNMIADNDSGPARNGILLRPETDTSDGNLTRSFVPRRIALCPTTLEVREPIIFAVIDQKKIGNVVVGGLVGFLIGLLLVIFLGALFALF